MSVFEKFELLGHMQTAMMIWVSFSPFCFDSFLVTFIGLFRSSCYFNLNFLLCKCRGLPRSTPVGFPVMRRWKCLGVKRSSQQSSITPGKRAEKTWRRGSRRDASSAKSGKSLFHFKPEKVNKFEYCNNLWKQNIFITQCGNWKCDFRIICMRRVLCVCKSLCKLMWGNKLL